jgi:hypothetical protein
MNANASVKHYFELFFGVAFAGWTNVFVAIPQFWISNKFTVSKSILKTKNPIALLAYTRRRANPSWPAIAARPGIDATTY